GSARRSHARKPSAGSVHRTGRHDAPEPAARRRRRGHRGDRRRRPGDPVPPLRGDDPVRGLSLPLLDVCPASDSSVTAVASRINRWLRLGLQTAFGLALLWLWLRTVSLPEV